MPVQQQAERIVFSENGDGTVTAIIEIQYTGPGSAFSWVLPVPGVPVVQVSSVVALDRLQAVSDPRYVLSATNAPGCGFATAGAGGSGGSSVAGAAGSAAPPDVIVLAEGTVGPFDYEVISLNPDLPEPADAAVGWLNDNGYDVTALAPERLGPYLEDGLNLIAFRLTKDADSGSIRPIRITYDAALPFIPIRPTAVAATEDMGIMVWVLGSVRAIPKNYKHLELNQARIDWFQFANNYDSVVNAAADEAGGQGFVTEMATLTEVLDGVVATPADRDQWTQIGSAAYADAYELLRDARVFSQWDGFADAVSAAVTLPQDVSLQDFLACTECYRMTDGVILDIATLRTGLWEKVVRPVFETQDLLDGRPFFTRFYTTMSADEMTVDPSFDFNPDLPTVTNVHLATLIAECDGTQWRVELPQGDVVYGSGPRVWPMDPDQPAALKILAFGTSGQGETVEDNTAKVKVLLAAAMPEGVDLSVPDPPAGGGGAGSSAATAGGASGAGASAAGGDAGVDAEAAADMAEGRNACGCRVPGLGGRDTGGAGALLLGLGLLVRIGSRRRRLAHARARTRPRSPGRCGR